MAKYGKNFYVSRESMTSYAAKTILSLVKKDADIKTVVDFGCGVGVWLKESENLGAINTLGIEGVWLDKEMYVADGELLQTDLEKEIVLENKFDLAISLEVAEHISEDNSNLFIQSICSASDTVLFSAAVIGQGGNGHINEQNQSYWVHKFKEQGFGVHDVLRNEIWLDDQVPFWYKQNIFLFKKKTSDTLGQMPLDIIHPDLFKIYANPSVIIRLKNILLLPKYLYLRLFR